MRSVPHGWRLVPRELLAWSTPVWGEKVLEVGKNRLPEGRIDLQTGTKCSNTDKKSATIMTYNAFEHTTPTSGIPQKVLSGFDIRVLSELIHLFQSKDESPDDALYFTSNEIIRGIEMKQTGTSLDKVEKSLEALATFRAYSSLDRTDYGECLLSFVETGNISITDGIKSTHPIHSRRTELGHKQRCQFWRIQLGSLMRAILRYPTLLTSYPLNVYKEVGRLPTAQWLVMNAFTHGHNNSEIYDYKLVTLAKKANLPDAITQRMIQALLKEEANLNEASTFQEEEIVLKEDAVLKEATAETTLKQKFMQAELIGKAKKLGQKSLKIGAKKVRQGLQRLINTGAFELMVLVKADDLLNAKVQAKRYDTATELNRVGLMAAPS